MQIAIQLKKNTQVPLQQQIYEGLRSLILDAALKPGQRVPSTRELASILAVSRTTATLAYEYLIAEGYLKSRGTGGTFVSDSLPEAQLWADVRTAPANLHAATKVVSLSKFAREIAGEKAKGDAKRLIPASSNSPSLLDFPIEVWRHLYKKQMRETSIAIFGYAPEIGCKELKEAICSYVALARGVSCRPEQVIVTFGSKQALDLVARVHLDEADQVAIENPGYMGAQRAFKSRGVNMVPLSVQASDNVRQLTELPIDTKLLYVTPSHQYPLGSTMPLEDRLRLLDWAKRRNVFIVEDDYDSEFRFGERPIPALQGLTDSNQVLYLGTFSKLVFPAIRIGYVVAPPSLAPIYRSFQDKLYGHPSYLDQLVLSDFITEGHLHRHVRRMRTLYAERRDNAIRLLRKVCKGAQIVGDTAGMHFVLRLQCSDEAALLRRLKLAGFEFRTTEGCYLLGYRPTELIVGFASLREHEIESAARALKKVLDSL